MGIEENLIERSVEVDWKLYISLIPTGRGKISVKIIYLIYFHCFFPADKSIVCVVKRGETEVINSQILPLPQTPLKKHSYKFQQSIDPFIEQYHLYQIFPSPALLVITHFAAVPF